MIDRRMVLIKSEDDRVSRAEGAVALTPNSHYYFFINGTRARGGLVYCTGGTSSLIGNAGDGSTTDCLCAAVRKHNAGKRNWKLSRTCEGWVSI